MKETEGSFYCDYCEETQTGYKCEYQGKHLKSEKTFPTNGQLQLFYVCQKCGVGIQDPMPSDEDLEKVYSNRVSEYQFQYEGKTLDTPVHIPWIGITLSRVKNLIKCLEATNTKIQSTDIVYEFGSYAGVFLNALRKISGCEPLGFELNQEGNRFAKAVYDIDVLAEDVYTYVPAAGKKPKWLMMVHVFEHFKYPQKLLNHIKSQVLEKNGHIYIEVPNFFAYEFSPVHHYHYCEASLRSLLERNGFEVKHLYHTSYPAIPTFNVPESNPSWLVCLAQYTGEVKESYPDAKEIIAEYHQSMPKLDSAIENPKIAWRQIWDLLRRKVTSYFLPHFPKHQN